MRAQTVATSAIVPFVIHIFEPLRIQSEPSRRAVVRIAPGSEPASGSVRPKQPIASPSCIAGSQRCFCSSEPQRQIEYIASEPWTETALRTPESPASSSMHASPYWTELAPGEAVALEVHAEEAELRELLDQLAREDPLLEPVADVREHALADELAHGVADRLLLVVEERVEREEVARVDRGGLGGDGHGAIVSSAPWGHSHS